MALSHVMNLVSNSGLVGAASGSGGGGGGGNLDSQAVTVGFKSFYYAGGTGSPSYTTNEHGFFTTATPTTYGSIADGTSNIYSGAAIENISYGWNTLFTNSNLQLAITGTGHANSGWTTLTIGSVAFLRTNASFGQNTGLHPGATSWVWLYGADTTGASNPFSGTGTVTTCVFT